MRATASATLVATAFVFATVSGCCFGGENHPAMDAPSSDSPASDAETPESEADSALLRIAVDDSRLRAPLPATASGALKVARALVERAERVFPNAVHPRLTRWRQIKIVPEHLDTIQFHMVQLPEVKATSVAPDFVPAALAFKSSSDGVDDDNASRDGESCPIQTPPYHVKQEYLGAIDVQAAWALPGGRGANVQLADVEGEWNFRHEDLPTTRLKHVAGMRMRLAGWRAHGTAVVGVIAAKENGIGMVGIAPDIRRVVTASMGRIGAARAIDEAQRKLSVGDVLIVELHGPGPHSDGRGQKGFVPMEFWQPEFDVIRTATERGIIVVEAAGNGGENLDHPVYEGKFDRSRRDSGAILVGAAAPHTRVRLGFSNYGARVDVHGWGREVATLDYGDLQGCSAAGRKYTKAFAGTSSASPVVAGAAVLIQSVHLSREQPPLTPLQMRSLLVDTGTPQAADPNKIGPLPHIGRALNKLGQ